MYTDAGEKERERKSKTSRTENGRDPQKEEKAKRALFQLKPTSFAALSTSSSLTPEGTEKGGHALGSLPFPSFTAARWAAAELPYAMLSATVPEKRPGDCPTTARRLQNQSGSRFLKSTPSKKTCPESGA
mmetsp:Transcript_55766/g.109174  ORF Transcript_55766/g.109174 Transcript_55766/m.109174 type:complete len:130 (+) Transcript_55766:744-1133(+)